jgi:MerR family transcriptional regulator/heat shock protein HspR
VDQEAVYDEPLYYISAVAKLLDLHPQTLRHYERLGLVEPQRTDGNVRVYSQRDIERLQQINRLTEELGINLAGVEVILDLLARIQRMRQEMSIMRRDYEQRVATLEAVLRQKAQP